MKLLKWAFLLVTAVFVLMMLAPNPITEPVPDPEERAVGWLREIHAAGIQYEAIYRNGRPPSLKALGPEVIDGRSLPGTCRASDLLDRRLAAGTKGGYVFAYVPGSAVGELVEGCPPGVEGYAVIARPVTYGTTGKRSFWMNESGVIRHTTEDRPATANDPPLN